MRGLAGGHPPHQRPHDRVLHAVQRAGSRPTSPIGLERDRVDRRHQQLQGQLHADDRRRDLARAGHLRRGLRRADLGEQLQPAALGARGRQRHVHGRARRPHPRAADGLPGRRVHPAHRLHAGRHPRQLRHREAAGRAHVPGSTSPTASAPRWANSPAAAPETTTGTSGSASRESSSESTAAGRRHAAAAGRRRLRRRTRRQPDADRQRRQRRRRRHDHHHASPSLDGVSPRDITVAVGSRVTFVNNDSMPHDMASDPHPEHTLCSGDQRRLHRRRPERHDAEPEHGARPARITTTISRATRTCRARSGFSSSRLPVIRRSRPAPASAPGRRRARATSSCVRRAGQHRERAPVHRHDLPHAEHRARVAAARPAPS